MRDVSEVPFEYLQHLVTVPVVVNRSVQARFVIDSGIGLSILSRSLFEAAGCTLTGSTYSGTRMSGQEVPVPIGMVGSMALGSLTRDELEVGLMDMSGFPPEVRGIGGFLSLGFFGKVAFTIDYPRRTVVLETEDTLGERAARGSAVVVRVSATSTPSTHSSRSRSPAAGRSTSRLTWAAIH